MVIDTLRRIAEILYFSLRCVDCLQDKGLRYVFCLILENMYNVFEKCVDLVAETLTGQRLLDELPTDWVKSD
jgi:hypothetical protein